MIKNPVQICLHFDYFLDFSMIFNISNRKSKENKLLFIITICKIRIECDERIMETRVSRKH